MYYMDEIRQVAEYGQQGDVEVKSQEVLLAQQLIESLAAPFQPQKYRDEFRVKVQELIEAKRQGQEMVAPPAPRLAPVIDLMEALQKSLASKKPPTRSAEAHAADAPEAEASAGRKKAARKG
jgi:DNA end-binding protein Ku